MTLYLYDRITSTINQSMMMVICMRPMQYTCEETDDNLEPHLTLCCQPLHHGCHQFLMVGR